MRAAQCVHRQITSRNGSNTNSGSLRIQQRAAGNVGGILAGEWLVQSSVQNQV